MQHSKIHRSVDALDMSRRIHAPVPLGEIFGAIICFIFADAFTLTGIPHCTLDDDTYRGMRIPGGSTIIPNIWWDSNNKSSSMTIS